MREYYFNLSSDDKSTIQIEKKNDNFFITIETNDVDSNKEHIELELNQDQIDLFQKTIKG